MNNPLFLKFRALIAWCDQQFDKTQVSIGDVIDRLPDYGRAIKHMINEMEQAYFSDNPHAMDEAAEKIKRLYLKGAARMPS